MIRALPIWGADWWVTSVFAAALVLGGATTQGHWSDAVIQIASLTLIPILAIQAGRFHTPSSLIGPLLLVLVAVAAPLAQLIPLSPGVWSGLAGRAQIYEGFIQAGIDPPWLALSLEPETTLRSCLSLVPSIALFLSAALLGPRVRRSMSVAVLAVAIVSVLLGLMQIAGGTHSSLRFYSITNLNSAVGFFANRNHNSALLYCGVAFLGAWTIGATSKKDEAISVTLAFCLLLYAILIFAVISCGSRAGLLLTLFAGLGFVAMSLREADRRTLLVSAKFGYSQFLVLSLVVIVSTALAMVAFSDQIQAIVDRIAAREARIEIYRTTWRAAGAFMPFGAGFGTFPSIYQMFEAPGQITPELINRAHNDWLELWLEGGVTSIAAVGAFCVWFAAANVPVWRRVEKCDCDFDRRLARASTVVVVLLALHSLVDYPLRTTAMSCVFALACGNLLGFGAGGRVRASEVTTRAGSVRMHTMLSSKPTRPDRALPPLHVRLRKRFASMRADVLALVAWRPSIRARPELIMVLIAGMIGVGVANSLFGARARVEATRPARINEPRLLEDPSTIAFAPSEFRARLVWREWRMGVALEWEATSDEMRIYRMPSARSKYIESNGRSGRLYDPDPIPGRRHWYVACSQVEGHEYCSEPVVVDVPDGI